MMRFSTLSPRVSRPLRVALLPLWLAACMPTAGESDWVATVNEREISHEALEDAVEPVAGDATGEAREEIVLRELEGLIREQVSRGARHRGDRHRSRRLPRPAPGAGSGPGGLRVP